MIALLVALLLVAQVAHVAPASAQVVHAAPAPPAPPAADQGAPDTLSLTLAQALAMAREKSSRFIRTQIQQDNAAITMNSAHAQRYYPTFNLDFTVPTYTSKLGSTPFVSNGIEQFKLTRTQRGQVLSNLNWSQPLPSGGTLQVTGNLTSTYQPLNSEKERFLGATNVGITLSQQLFGVNQSIRTYRLAQEQFANSQAQFIDQERNFAQQLLNTYFSLVRNLKQAQIDSVTALRDSVRNATAPPRAAGAAGTSEVDSLKFELEAARSAFNRTRSQQALLRARMNLNATLSLPLSTVIIPSAEVAVERFVPNVEEGLAFARENRPDLKLAQMGVDNRQSGLSDAKRTSPVTLSINTTLGFNGSADDPRAKDALAQAFSRQNRSQDLSLKVSVPLFDRFNERNAVARSRNDLRSAELTLVDEERSLEQEVRLAADGLKNAGTQLDLAQRQSDLTQRVLVSQTRRYDAKEITSVEFLLDQTSARTAEIALIDAQVGMLTALEEWRRAIGERSLIAGPASQP